MIIATYLLPRFGNKLPNAKLVMYNGSDFHFVCNCTQEFSMARGNHFDSPEQFQCRNCKRRGKMAPNVGERYIFRRVKSDAHTADREFELEFDWFVEAIHMPCFYCGRRDINSSVIPSKRKGETLIPHFRYNGIDRIHNEVGYVKDNCVPSCIVCNRAKNSMPYDEFIEWIETMVKFRSGITI